MKASFYRHESRRHVHVRQRLAAAGLASTGERQTTCCYAVQDMFWVERWEIYTVLADAEVFGPDEEACHCCGGQYQGGTLGEAVS